MTAKSRGVRDSALEYNAELALQICMRIAQGETLTDICRDKLMPTYTAVMKWRVTFPEFEEAYENARRISAFALEDEAIAAARKLAGPNNFNAPRVSAMAHAMNQLRWSAEKRNTDKFGVQKPGVTMIPIQINTTLDLGQGGVAPMQSDVYTIAAHYTEELDSLDEQKVSEDDTLYEGELAVPQNPRRLIQGKNSPEYREIQKADAARRKHKTPQQIAATKAAHAIRNNRKAAKEDG